MKKLLFTLALLGLLIAPLRAHAYCTSRYFPSVFTFVQPQANGYKLIQLDMGDGDYLNARYIRVETGGHLYAIVRGTYFSKVVPPHTTWTFYVGNFDSCGTIIGTVYAWTYTNP